MNIFVLDYNPKRAVRMLCDKHVVKMPLETAQILCAPFDKAPYRRTHFNHPCTIWARTSKANYQWLINYGIELCGEFTYRYNKVHKSQAVIEWCQQNMTQLSFERQGKTPYALCFDQRYMVGNAVESYREYYRQAKREIACWGKGRGAPGWFDS